jgi:hypothetical protein
LREFWRAAMPDQPSDVSDPAFYSANVHGSAITGVKGNSSAVTDWRSNQNATENYFHAIIFAAFFIGE